MCLALGGSAAAQTATLVIGVEDYDRIADVRRADSVYALNEMLRSGVRSEANPDSATIQSQVARFETDGRVATRQLVVLSGRFVHSATETYFLASDARPASLAETSATALPLSTVLAILAETPGDAVLALATDTRDGAFGDLLSLGVGDIDIPQGVTVLQSDPRSMTSALNTVLRTPGRRLSQVVERSDIRQSGYLRDDQVLRDVAAPEPAPAEEQPATTTASTVADLLAWREADRKNTSQAYQGYLDAHPNGRFIAMAQGRLQALLDTPEARAERAEQRLDLNRTQRREIQRALTLLDYNTRGIDGIFGRGTRAAIAGWQGDNGFEQTGFLDETQVRDLDRQARRRAEQLEIEAEERRQTQLALDRAFWDETGSGQNAAGNTAYLERYPDGQFADIARENLAALERAKRRDADLQDRQAWNDARIQDTVAAYERYLAVMPNGAFHDEARARMRELNSQNSNENQQARRQEDALSLSPQPRRLIESRLQRFGLDPGAVDGTFTDDTRRAIRRYQDARGLPQTGYLTEDVIVRILADSVRSIFQ